MSGAEQKKVDFFISRAGEDAAKALWIGNTLEAAGYTTIIQDKDIRPGQSFLHEMDLALGRANHIIAVLSPNYVAKEFTRSELYAALFQDPLGKKRLLIPVRVAECDIPPMLSHLVYIDLVGKDDFVAGKLLLDGVLPAREGAPAAKHVRRVFVSKLPAVDPALFGRGSELAFLDQAWADPATNLIQIIAPGGTGKTALTTKWFRPHREEATIFGWSFYSQGASEDRQTSSDPFFADILSFFGISVPATASIFAKAEALARHLREERVLLILDGIEPLQDPSGELRDSALKALLQELAEWNKGLVVCTTRVRLTDVPDDPPRTRSIDLDNLDPHYGAQYLRHLGVTGEPEELQQASVEYANHALALTLLGTYLVDFLNSDVRRRIEIPELMIDDVKAGRHARRVMESYARMFQGQPELDILRGLGYFNRPAEPEALKLVLPAMPDLTYRAALNRLRKARLILRADPSAPIDCHPLIREHFAHVMRQSAPEAFREGHSRLYEHYSRSAPQYPETLEQMTPLFYAVYHGCQAEQYQETLDAIYYDRIQRRRERYSTQRLGAYGTRLSLVANFFRSPWTEPVSNLSRVDQLWLINQAGFSLKAVGRLREALTPIRMAAERYTEEQVWLEASLNYRNLADLNLALGNLSEAAAAGYQAVELAERSGDPSACMLSKASLAACFHQLGMSAECSRLFEEAERLQGEKQPQFPILYSFQGHLYSQFLFDVGQGAAVLRRATQTLQWAEKNNWPLDIGLDHVSLGCAYPPSSPESSFHLDQAVEYLRRAGNLSYLPVALLARGTQRDLDEVYRLATRCGMRLYLTDYHLAQARYLLGQRRIPEAREHTDKAAVLIAETGYHRRDRELEELRQALAAATPQS
ncbi:MAG TPA: toll/interleukin-1 receptor domain-containing protein [Bryobacteraceae bacterium]|jgi:tetratricopeptide (TPR) repeat protein|nr:toll/interleukin-1 receptor domain-containing protein [Bryobacteraceae bacterium]